MPFATINHTHLFYTRLGSGVPCLAMHGGLGLDQNTLRGLDRLSDVFELVYYDHRNNGRSGRTSLKEMSHAQLTADADALRRHLGFEKVAVLGHSYGGFLALEYALSYPESVSHLLLLDTAPVFNYGEEILRNALAKQATPAMIEALQAPAASTEALRQSLATYFPLYFHRYDPSYATMLDGVVFSGMEGRQEEMLSTYNVLPRLSSLTCPTLILVGQDDFICPPSQSKTMHELIPQSDLVIFEQSGHLPWIEEAEAFDKAVRLWMAQHSCSS